MKPVAELDWISKGLAVWHGFNTDVRCECGSTAVLTPHGWVIFDPLPLDSAAWAEILGIAKVHAIALTNGNHQRESLTLKALAPIHAPEAARGEIEADVWLKEGESLAGFSLIELPGAGPGEAAWCDGKHLVVGDALINLDSLEFLPDKYCSDPAQLRRSARKILSLEFHSVFFSHGLPLLTRASERIAALLT